jgi:hypothetical protein
VPVKTRLSRFVLSTRPIDLGFSEEKQCVLAVSLVVPLEHVKTLRALAQCTLRTQAVEQREELFACLLLRGSDLSRLVRQVPIVELQWTQVND